MNGGELVFRGSRRKAIVLLFIAVGLVAVGVFLILEDVLWGWLMACFFGLGIPVAIFMLRPDSTYLKLDKVGFELKSGFKPMKLKWTDVDGFSIASIYGNKTIAIRYSDSYKQLRAGRRIAAAISGMEGALPGHFQSTPEEICETLNLWKQKFGGGAA